MKVKNPAVLTDVTRCIGCEKCVQACQKANSLPKERPWRWLKRIDDLSSSRWTTIKCISGENGPSFVRRQCRHCLDPECVSVCIVGALKKSPEGPVIYDRDICIGCRYCMIACPWEIPRYSWEDTIPYVQKCDFCYERMVKEDALPACVEACPAQATIFGNRDDLLAEAHSRLRREPNKYVQHVWGETEVGGASVLYISDIDLNLTDLDVGISASEPMPIRTTKILHQMPTVFVGMAAVMGGIHWVIARRQKLMPDGQRAPEETVESAEETSASEKGEKIGEESK